MHERCEACGLKYQRDPGYFLGAIYFNYGLTALLIAIAYPLLVFVAEFPTQRVLLVCLAFCLLFPLWFFRYSRSLWIGMDQYFDPSQDDPPS